MLLSLWVSLGATALLPTGTWRGGAPLAPPAALVALPPFARCPRAGPRAPRCCDAAQDAPSTSPTSSTSPMLGFDAVLAAILAEAEEKGSMDAALSDARMEQLDEKFIPQLGSMIDSLEDDPDRPRWVELMAALEKRSAEGYERARDQLQELLSAGEINKMDTQLAGLVKRGEVDAGLFYVILRNIQDAASAGDEGGVRLLQHIYTRLQEELEKKTQPALALLHKLTRMDQPSVRANILVDSLVPQTETLLPDGTTLPLKTPSPAKVKPLEFAAAVEGALEQVINLPVERSAIDETCEEIRSVAKEARVVIAEHYPQEALDEFTDALTPAFTRAMPQVVQPGGAESQ